MKTNMKKTYYMRIITDGDVCSPVYNEDISNDVNLIKGTMYNSENFMSLPPIISSNRDIYVPLSNDFDPPILDVLMPQIYLRNNGCVTNFNWIVYIPWSYHTIPKIIGKVPEFYRSYVNNVLNDYYDNNRRKHEKLSIKKTDK